MLDENYLQYNKRDPVAILTTSEVYYSTVVEDMLITVSKPVPSVPRRRCTYRATQRTETEIGLSGMFWSCSGHLPIDTYHAWN